MRAWIEKLRFFFSELLLEDMVSRITGEVKWYFICPVCAFEQSRPCGGRCA
jgi:hypothetical protein